MEKLRRFLAYYRPHIGLFVLDLTCALVVAAVDVAFPLVTQYILRTLLPAMALDSALVSTFVLLIVCLVCAYFTRAVLQYIIGPAVYHRLLGPPAGHLHRGGHAAGHLHPYPDPALLLL